MKLNIKISKNFKEVGHQNSLGHTDRRRQTVSPQTSTWVKGRPYREIN